MRFRVRVYVTLKQTVLDPQGSAVSRALQDLGYEGVRDVRIGKMVDMSVEAEGPDEARAKVEQIAKRLLANPVLEEFSVSLEPASARGV
ncbi:MAG: phosphoribosylformylglycinamidine synthase subunit PurS [Bacillota bacterium]